MHESINFCFSEVLQLIKSQKFLNKLVILVETEKEKILRKEYVFADSKKREGFCQLLQQMKNKHSEQPEPDMITIFIGTWNMGGSLCPLHPTSSTWVHLPASASTSGTRGHLYLSAIVLVSIPSIQPLF